MLENTRRLSLWGPLCLGTLIVLVFATIAAAWFAFVALEKAVKGSGKLTFPHVRHSIQPPHGGVVEAIFVSEGDYVKAGDPILELDITVAQSQFALARSEIASAKAELLRRIAQRDGVPPETLKHQLMSRLNTAGDFIDIIHNEVALLEAHQDSKKAQESELRAAQAEIELETANLNERLVLLQELFALAQTREKTTQVLASQNHVSEEPLRQAKAQRIQLQEQILGIESQIKAATLRSEREQFRFEERNARLATENLSTIARLRNALAASEQQEITTGDIIRKSSIVAPISGQAIGVRLSLQGQVVSAGEVLLDIVPESPKLIAEIRLSPNEAKLVHEGDYALVQLIGEDVTALPRLSAQVSSISSDVLVDETTGVEFFLVQLDLSADALADTSVVSAGRVIEASILGNQRSSVAWLLGLLRSSVQRTELD